MYKSWELTSTHHPPNGPTPLHFTEKDIEAQEALALQGLLVAGSGLSSVI